MSAVVLPGFRLRGRPPTLLKFVLVSTLVFPSYMVLGELGAIGNVAHLLALALFALWFTSSLFGHHDPAPYGHPGRAAMMFWLVASCASYAAMFGGLSGGSDLAARAAADRWMLLVLAGAGITLVMTESIRGIDDVRSVVRWVMAGAAVCCVVALIQFQFRINPVEWISSLMIGFEDNGSGSSFQQRESFLRVAGTTMHPIELSVVCSMLLPLAVWWALFDIQVRRWVRWSLPILLVAGNVITVSRTGMLGLLVSTVILLPYLPKLARQWALIVIPAGVAVVFIGVPGMVSTLFYSATAGTADSSITYRTDDYPLAWTLFFDRPLFGLGPGSWMPVDMKNIFDNQYLLTVATMGGVGLIALLAYFMVPVFACLTAAHHAKSSDVRVLCGAVASAMLVAAISAGTFDAMSFQTFALICPFFIGLAGVAWLTVKQRLTNPFENPHPVFSRANYRG
jgi:O-antigen ligase